MIRPRQLLTVKYIIPFGLIAVLGFILFQGLQRDPSELPSALIDKPLPTLSLPEIFSGEIQDLPQILQGRVTLINIWATWCQSCQIEQPLLKQLTRQSNVNLYGIVYKDSRSKALQWLSSSGNPYQEVWLDETGNAGIELGVYGTPELYVIDKQGIIRYRHAGILSDELINKKILPLVENLNKESNHV